MKKMILMVTMLLMLVCQSVFASSYPATLDNGNLIFVDNYQGVGIYADRSSVFVEVYTPGYYQVSIKTVAIKDGKGERSNVRTHHFRYERDTKKMAYLSIPNRGWDPWVNWGWEPWDLNKNYGHDGGDPLIINLAEVAFVTAYDKKYFGDMERTVAGKTQRVIPESLYQALGI